MLISPTDAIAAIATPPGTGALAIVRVSGAGALRAAAAVLGRAEEALPPRRACLASARDQEGDIDQVVALYHPAARSPTGEDLVELTCHGSVYIQRRLLAALLAAGARAARPGEFTQRAFLSGRLDLAQAEAVCDLIAGGTRLAHRSALSQLEGGLSSRVAGLRGPVLELLTHLEACLDHPDEDIAPLPRTEAQSRLHRLAEPVARLADTFRTGRILREGLRVCIVGRPNAGKSSLLNALLGHSRAIVCAEPGTTRDVLEEPCDLAGLPAVLVDTAGLGHDSRGAADEEGLARAQRALRASDLALLVIDGSRPVEAADESAHRRVLDASAADGRPVITVLSKTDLPRRAAAAPWDCAVSALRGAGVEELKRLVAERLGGHPDGPAEPGATVTHQRHHAALRRCAAELEEAALCVGREPGCWEELCARNLREALSSLDEITGPAAGDEVLHGIFSRFCLGK
ncbi:MAG: tRNA uridine-5-carboxymethylaminomethyl(34) synthesis GTPase MnmE [Elusimicrobia bacterium]|nr:tRNA uridine-5-carboxymethylaminomethyl(34) synthesis GTPase MnmE [Elusimicrobiota bacterium]